MSTIFTDDFSCDCDTEIEIGDRPFGYHGRELCISTSDAREFRVQLSDEQIRALADALLIAGFEQERQL